jgi:hypothetical protein
VLKRRWYGHDIHPAIRKIEKRRLAVAAVVFFDGLIWYKTRQCVHKTKMTKDWDAVQDIIKDLSWNQRKPLEEVKVLMEKEHGFLAS